MEEQLYVSSRSHVQSNGLDGFDEVLITTQDNIVIAHPTAYINLTSPIKLKVCMMSSHGLDDN